MEKYHVGLSIKPDAIGWSLMDDNFKLKKAYPLSNKNAIPTIGADKFTPGKLLKKHGVSGLPVAGFPDVRSA